MRDAYLWSALNPESSAERNFHASELCCVEHSDWFGKNKDPSIDFCFYKKITRTIRALPSFQIFFIVCKINFSNQRLLVKMEVNVVCDVKKFCTLGQQHVRINHNRKTADSVSQSFSEFLAFYQRLNSLSFLENDA